MKFWIGFFIVLFFIGLGLTIPIIVTQISFKRNCSGYMMRAANANTIELAKDEMDKVVEYLEKNNLTSGFTSVFYETPDEDIEYFYQNMKSSREELYSLSTDSSPLEKSNILMKLRESLLRDNVSLVYPDGLQFYPHNILFGILLTIAIIFMLFGLFVPLILII